MRRLGLSLPVANSVLVHSRRRSQQCASSNTAPTVAYTTELT